MYIKIDIRATPLAQALNLSPRFLGDANSSTIISDAAMYKKVPTDRARKSPFKNGFAAYSIPIPIQIPIGVAPAKTETCLQTLLSVWSFNFVSATPRATAAANLCINMAKIMATVASRELYIPIAIPSKTLWIDSAARRMYGLAA